jgi:alkanesulfonate monooxygenase SsuD/methylene tetrahydromethanopterin reductase-like flavin-dependent oxidoreductase (luciferase family)
MKVRFGISFGSTTPLVRRDDTQRFMDLVKMADDYGAAALGTFDTAFIGGDAYVRATLIAQASARARVGLRPTNPLTREPQIMAAFLAQIDALTDGRAFMDIASGDSAVFNIGLKSASRARIEDYITCIRGLIAQGEGTYQGRAQRVRWAKTAVRPRVPISICAEGPKTLHLAGRIGDGVVAGTGLLPEVIKDTIARVHAGAREAGRKPDDVEIWFTARSSLHEDRATGIDNVRASVSSILNHSMRFGLDGKSVPDDLRGKVQAYVDSYELYDHVLQEGQNPKRMEALGLTQYAIDRFALAGNASDWIERIEQVAAAGADRLWIGVSGHGFEQQAKCLRVIGTEIMRRFT